MTPIIRLGKLFGIEIDFNWSLYSNARVKPCCLVRLHVTQRIWDAISERDSPIC